MKKTIRFDAGGGLKQLKLKKMGIWGGIFKHRGFKSEDILHHWESIVGASLVKWCTPVRLSEDGVLFISSVPEVMVELRYKIPLLLQRMALHLGSGVVQKVRITTDFVAMERACHRKREEVKLDAQQEEALQEKVKEIKSDFLRGRLLNLGRNVLAND